MTFSFPSFAMGIAAACALGYLIMRQAERSRLAKRRRGGL